jgi:hypothetical protein
MSKTRRNYNDDYYEDDEGHADHEEYVRHKKEKRINRALKTLDIDELLNLEEDED